MKRINNQLWTDRSFIGKIIKNEKGFTSCVFKSGLAVLARLAAADGASPAHDRSNQ